jgi:uncharacterized membrane protein
LLGSILHRSGADLVGGFHLAMLASAVACIVAAMAASSIAPALEPDPASGL